MLCSTKRQQRLSGWLRQYDGASFSSSLKLQKFLLLYDLMSINAGEKVDTSHLRGYENGPVYSDVYGDYTHERMEFITACINEYAENPDVLDRERAICAAFYVMTHTEQEISAMTHKLHLWNAKQHEIEARYRNQVSLNIDDYNENDKKFVDSIFSVYGDNYYNTRSVIQVNDKYFAFPKDDAKKITPEQYDFLWSLTLKERDLVNPVYAELSDDGALIIDD